MQGPGLLTLYETILENALIEELAQLTINLKYVLALTLDVKKLLKAPLIEFQGPKGELALCH
ncbi:MAG: hypothetical protein EB012_09515 [Gammaproteobacteria bacterium]|nr:hypothetical protein [Gammaproteobacteria bacterium]